MNKQHWVTGLRRAAVIMVVILLGGVALPALAKKGEVTGPASKAVTFKTIAGSPLQIRVGEDHSFQIFNSEVPGVGQVYPSGTSSTADMGWFVRVDGALHAPDFRNHAGTATSGLGTYTAYTPQSLGNITGTGTAANPFALSVAAALGSTGLVATEQVTYVNGRNYFVKHLTVKNNSSSSKTLKVYLGADIYLAASDRGVPYRVAASGSIGGQNCTTPATYSILFIPQTPAGHYSAASFGDIWRQIGSATDDLNDQLSTGCIDNGAALQWNRTIAAGASVTIQASTSFGDIPTITEFDITSVTPSSLAQGATANVTIRGVGFLQGTTFNFGNGITLSNLVIVDATKATAKLTAATAATVGNRDVTGKQGGSTLTATLTNGFKVTAAPPPPSGFTISAVTPSSAAQGSNLDVTVTGTGFTAGSTFKFGNGTMATKVVRNSATKATVSLTVVAGATVGTRDVTGKQGGSTLTATLVNGFRVTAAGGGGFTVSAVTPTSAAQGTSLDVTVTGTGFTAGSTFKFGNGTMATKVVLSGTTKATVSLTVVAGAAVGTRDVVGKQGGSTLTATLVNGFRVTAAGGGGFTVTSVTPASAEQGVARDVTVAGTGFSAGTSFSFGNGIAVTKVVLTGTTSAKVSLVIASSAVVGMRDVTGAQGGSTRTATRVNGFQVIAGPVARVSSSQMRIAAGRAHACAIDAAGQARCWGDGTNGQLGDVKLPTSSAPTTVGGPKLVTVFASQGGNHSCGLTAAGAAWCWGRNDKGQLGIGNTTDRTAPIQVAGLASGVSSLALGAQHTCALMRTGTVKCWGDGSNGRLGTGSTARKLMPVDLSALGGTATALGAGGAHTCAVMQDRKLKCWGRNAHAQLGIGSQTDQLVPVAVSLGTSRVVDVALGDDHSCALTTTGGALCWGRGENGRLGTGATVMRATPAAVTGLPGVVAQIGAGGAHTCALLENGSLYCWGQNTLAQLGDTNRVDVRSTPAVVANISGAIRQFALGSDFSCVMTDGNVVRCWGSGADGRLGRGTESNIGSATLKRPISGLPSTVYQASQAPNFGCAATEAGAAYCWGINEYGQLGDGAKFGSGRLIDSNGPRPVEGLSARVAAVNTGGEHACAVLIDGSVWCWGRNQFGQLALAGGGQQNTPVRVSGLAAASAVVAGDNHTCALTQAGGVRCWGNNASGQLGDGTLTTRTAPVNVSGLTSGVAAISAGSRHTCALLTNGKIKCWGNNDSRQLGDNSATSRKTPVDLADTDTWKAISAGREHTCGVTTAGRGRCWGSATDGRLGNGATSGTFGTPQTVTGFGWGVTAIEAARGNHSCAIQNGAVNCWGENLNGQLGNRSANFSATPVVVTGLSGSYAGLTVGERNSCVRASGIYQCWGYGGLGATGTGVDLPIHMPIPISRFITSEEGANRLPNDQALGGQSGAAGQWTEYVISVPPGARDLIIETSGGTGTIHIFVQYAGLPTPGSNICARQTAGTNKTCTIANPEPGDYLITVRGETEYSGVVVKGRYVSQVSESVPVTGLTGMEGTMLSFTVLVPTGMRNLRVAVSGGSGDVDLYVRRGSLVSLESFDCASTGAGSEKACEFANPTSGIWSVLVYGRTAFVNVTMVAGYNDGAGAYELTMRKAGTGNGSISTDNAAFGCGPSNWPCSVALAAGSSVTLKPTAAAGSTFTGWQGCAVVTGNSCVVVANRAYSVTASFTASVTAPLQQLCVHPPRAEPEEYGAMSNCPHDRRVRTCADPSGRASTRPARALCRCSDLQPCTDRAARSRPTL